MWCTLSLYKQKFENSYDLETAGQLKSPMYNGTTDMSQYISDCA